MARQVGSNDGPVVVTEKSGMWHQAGRLVGILVRVVQVVSRILGLAAALIILLMLLANAVDIVLRTTGNEPLRGIFEYTEVALVAIVFLGLPYTMQIGGHVAIDSVTTRMPAVVRRYVEAIALIAVLPFVLWLTVASVDVAIDSYREREVKFGVV